MVELERRVLFRSALVTVTDVRCRATDRRCGREETSTAHQLVFTRSGVFVKHVSGARVVADPTHALFFNAGQPYQVSHPADHGDECTSLTFAGPTIQEVVRQVTSSSREHPDEPFPWTHRRLAPGSQIALHRLRQALRDPGPEALRIDEGALEVLDRALRGASAGGQTLMRTRDGRALRARRAQVEAVRERLAARPEAKPSLEELARAVACSPFHLTRTFREVTGLPVHQHLLRLRLGLALARLADGERNLTWLALDLGFCSHGHFTTAFRRAFGTPPSSLRRTLTGGRLRQLRKNVEA